MTDETKEIFTIGDAARMLNIHPETLKTYEQNGLIQPMRKGNWRYFTKNDIKWIRCIRNMIHEHGISINAVKKLLHLTLCWNISDCPFEKRQSCTAFQSSGHMPQHNPHKKNQVFWLHGNAA
jgi:MerR family transcriptional regulator/heat shock protein HspR